MISCLFVERYRKLRVLETILAAMSIVVVNDFRRFLRQFSTNFHEISYSLFSIHAVIALKVSR